MASWYIGIRVEESDIEVDFNQLIAEGNPFIIRDFGHVMITITDPDANAEVFGWMPNESKSQNETSTLPGHIDPDQREHSWDFEKRVTATEAQVAALRQYVAEINAIETADAGKSSADQTLRYYAIPWAASLVGNMPTGKVAFNCVTFASECLQRAGITSLTNALTPYLSPGAVQRDDPDLRQQAGLAGVSVFDRRFVEGQALADTLTYNFTAAADVADTGNSDFVVVSQGRASGGVGRDFLFGGSGANGLSGGEQDDYLDGAAGNDTLDGGEGNDKLLGGAGADTYVFSGAFGKDTITDDSNGEGTIKINDRSIAGTFEGAAGSYLLNLGSNQYARLTLIADSRSTTGYQAVITSGNDTANTITIVNFDLVLAQGEQGYLGIKLGPRRAVLAEAGNPAAASGNPFGVLGFDPANITASAAFGETGGEAFRFFLDSAAKPGDVLKLSVNALGDKLAAIIGDQTAALPMAKSSSRSPKARPK
jgi:hypothetical protein